MDKNTERQIVRLAKSVERSAEHALFAEIKGLPATAQCHRDNATHAATFAFELACSA